MQPPVSYILYAISLHEKPCDIITFAQFEDGNLVENECNEEEDKSSLSSIDESSTDDESDYLSISTNDLEDILEGSQIHPEINARDDRLKIRDRIRQTQNEWKGSELSEKRMGKGLHKLFKEFVNELKNALPPLGELGSEESHFILEPRIFLEVTRLPDDTKKDWLKATLKDIKHVINNKKFLMYDSDKGYPVTTCMDVYKVNI